MPDQRWLALIGTETDSLEKEVHQDQAILKADTVISQTVRLYGAKVHRQPLVKFEFRPVTSTTTIAV
jgi:hypothetical protein